jgi:hypothetical protein
MIKINVSADVQIEDIIIEDLYYNTFNVKNNQSFDTKSDWFLLKVPYNGIKNEIIDIEINGHSIDYLKYTGWFENNKNEKFQPAMAVWEPGNFKIWLHKNLGFLKHSLHTQILNGDFGKNLFEKYIFTCDYSIKIDGDYTQSIKSFFEYPFGPKWWKKDDANRPFIELNKNIFETVDKQTLIDEVFKISKYQFQDKKNKDWKKYWLKETTELPFVDVAQIQGQEIQKIINAVGYKSIINIQINTLCANSALDLHIDDNTSRKAWPYIKGCKQLHWTLSEPENNYFKMAEQGIMPSNSPNLINAGVYTHSFINNSSNIRYSLSMFGDLEENILRHLK